MRLRFSVPLFFFGCVFVHGVFAGPFPPPGMSLPEYWGEEHVWWDGRATFHGEVVRPACTLAMEDAWQIIDMGETPVRDLQNGFSGPERKFSLRLRNCEFNSQGGNLFSDSRIRVTFDGVRGETPDKFNLSGQAKGINLQIADARGNIARAGKVMPAIPLTGNEEALDYTLRIVGNGKKLEAGNYFAVLGFRVDYE